MLSRFRPFQLSKEQENSYRQSCQKTDILQSRIGLLLFMMPVTGLIINDLHSFTPTPMSYGILAIRFSILICFIISLTLLGRVKDYHAYDLTIVALSLSYLAGSGVINLVHPPDFVFHITLVSIGIFVVYLVLPNRFVNQILVALALTLGDMAVILVTHPSSYSNVSSVFLNYVLANIIAFLSSWQIHSYRRRSYQDLTNYKRAQEDLEEHSKNLERLVVERTEKLKDAERLAAIGATAGMVGHDIRNPLTAITGAVYVANTRLKSFPESEEKQSLKENLDLIGDQTLYVNKIVADLQDYARPLTPEITTISIEGLFQSVFSTLKVPENIKIHRSVEPISAKLRTDSSFLQRIIFNLSNNAVQAMPNGGVLTVRATCKDGKAYFEVTDTGGGIPLDVRKKLFTPLYTTKSKGQGFGLAVVKRLSEALGGKVTFESEIGKGTSFHIEVPA
jgi:signal transduction histidine kinase